MLEDDLEAQPNKKLSTWKNLCLALIVIVDGVVVCSNSNAGRVTPRFVEMLHEPDFYVLPMGP